MVKSKIIVIILLFNILPLMTVQGSGGGITPAAGTMSLVDDLQTRSVIILKKHGDILVGESPSSFIKLITVDGNLDNLTMVVKENLNTTTGGSILLCAPDDKINKINNICLYLNWPIKENSINVTWKDQAEITRTIPVISITINDTSGVKTSLQAFSLEGPGLITITRGNESLHSQSKHKSPFTSITYLNDNFFWPLFVPVILLVISIIVSRLSFIRNRVT